MGPVLEPRDKEIYSEPPYRSKRTYDASGRHTGYVERECFIATACLEAQGLSADCWELNTLREFRDRFIRSLPLGAALVKIYYLIAPKIVARIDATADSEAIYWGLYQNMVLRSIELIEQGKNKVAFFNACKICVGLTIKSFFFKKS